MCRFFRWTQLLCFEFGLGMVRQRYFIELAFRLNSSKKSHWNIQDLDFSHWKYRIRTYACCACEMGLNISVRSTQCIKIYNWYHVNCAKNSSGISKRDMIEKPAVTFVCQSCTSNDPTQTWRSILPVKEEMNQPPTNNCQVNLKQGNGRLTRSFLNSGLTDNSIHKPFFDPDFFVKRTLSGKSFSSSKK